MAKATQKSVLTKKPQKIVAQRAAIRLLIAGNWKMNGVKRDLSQIAQVERQVSRMTFAPDVAICPPATLLMMAAGSSLKTVKLGGQDCHPKGSGAHTGDISAAMLKNAGARYVIVGHSERRQDHGESSSQIAAKATIAVETGLTPIICLGETLAERTKKQTLRVIGQQLKNSMPSVARASQIVIAYEPIWAIGSGLTPTHAEIEQAHAHLRKGLIEILGKSGNAVRILYGGSVKPDNAREILALANVNGALVGGASLKAVDFMKIIKSAV